MAVYFSARRVQHVLWIKASLHVRVSALHVHVRVSALHVRVSALHVHVRVSALHVHVRGPARARARIALSAITLGNVRGKSGLQSSLHALFVSIKKLNENKM